MSSMEKASTFEETIRIFSFSYGKANPALAHVAEVRGGALSPADFSASLPVLQSEMCGFHALITVDDRKTLQSCIEETIL